MNALRVSLAGFSQDRPMATTVPQHLEARLRDAHAKLQETARLRGLEEAFAMDLFSVSVTVDEALASGSRGLVEHALKDVRLLERHLQSVPAKPSPLPGPTRSGR